jgi:hypothetical protein
MKRPEQFEFSDIIDGMPTADADPVAVEIKSIQAATEEYGALVSTSEAARFLGVSAQAVFSMIKRGKLTEIPCRYPKVPLSEVLARLASEKDKGGRPKKVA